MTTVQHYPKVNLRDHAFLIRGITFKPHQKTDIPSDDAIVCLRTANVQSNVDWRSLIYIPKSLVKSTDKILREKDILISTANSNNLVGKCCLIRSLQVPATLGGFISAIRANGESLDASYLYHYLNSDEIQALLRSISRQTTNISNLPTDQLLNVQIPLPPLPIQKRIAAILEKADAAREKRRQTIELTEKFLQSAFLDMFGDPVTNPKGWEVVTVDNVTTHVTSGSTPLGGQSTYLNAGVLFIRSQNVLMNAVDFSDIAFISDEVHKNMKRTWVKTSDVLLNITGASIGRVSYFKGKDDSANVNQHVCIVRPDKSKIIPEYLSFYISMPRYQSLILSRNSGATRQAFNFEQIRQFKINLPPFALQLKFAALVEKVEAMRTKQRASEQELDLLFQSLMQRAFKGELV